MTDYALTIYSNDGLCPYYFAQMMDYVPPPIYSNDRLCPYHFTQMTD